MLNIFVTNLGKYNEGELMGEWVNLPCDDFESVFERIGISDEPDENGIYYEEYFITDYESDIDGVSVGEYDSLDDLNDMAEALEGVDGDIIGALIGDGYSLEEALDMADDCIYWQGMDMMDIAYEIVEECYNLEEPLANYFDYEAFARDLEIEGHYIEISGGIVEVRC